MNHLSHAVLVVLAALLRWYFQQLVVTLDYLHAKGVSHRDIKLENALYKASDRTTHAGRMGSLHNSRCCSPTGSLGCP